MNLSLFLTGQDYCDEICFYDKSSLQGMMFRDGSEIEFSLRQLHSLVRDPLVKMKLTPLDRWDRFRNVIIVSTGRTGTHFFSHFFTNNFDHTYAVHEPQPDSFYINQRFVRRMISANRAEMMFRQYRHKTFKELEKNGFKNYVESNPNITALLPLAKKVFGNYRILHIIRDGRDVVRSLYSQYAHGKWVGSVPYLSKKDPRNRLRARFFPDDPYYHTWNKMSRFEKICWVWAKKTSIITDAIQNDPNAKTYKFNALFVEKDPETWNDLIEFSGLKDDLNNPDHMSYITGEKSNSTSKYLLPKYHQWPEEFKQAFKEIAGTQMDRYGYDFR